MARLVLGPLLRHVGERDATVWVETDGPCEVSALGASARTFHVGGHHYALVAADGLEPGTATPYAVALDGVRAWPQPGSPFPPSVVRTVQRGAPLRLLFGSCRVAAPHARPWTLSPDDHPDGRGEDTLVAATHRMAAEPVDRWPHAAVLVGDQVYADEVSSETLAFIRARRDTTRPPGEEVADFEEYTRLYRESWSDPAVRWFLSTVSTAMLFDDHDVHDDWNVSAAWAERMRATPWWEERILGAFVSYWLYQHLGNLAPAELAADELYAAVRAADDGEPLLREFARRAHREPGGRRWSFSRTFGGVRVLAIDCRAGRVLDPGDRRMVDPEEWAWIEEAAAGDWDHLLLALSDPFLLAPGIHGLEAWSEAVCAGAWGRRAQRLGERVREGLDLDHWAAFGRSFEDLAALVGDVAAGRRGRAPATVVALSGDVHNAYLAEAAHPNGGARVYQAVCSPLRNPLGRRERAAQRLAASRLGTTAGRALARAAGVPPPRLAWRLVEGPTFENQIATLDLAGREARLALETARGGELSTVFARRLA